MKIEDQVLQFPMTLTEQDDMILEFFVCKTNELNPYREIKELGIVVYERDEEKRKSDNYRQIDNFDELGLEDIEKLIKYLQKVKKHIKTFNENSKPSE